MSVSVDYRQLELLSQFVGFIEALQDVQKIKGLLEDAKQVLAKKEELLGAEATKEGADKYAAEVKEKADALKASVEEEMNKHQVFMQLEKDKINKMSDEFKVKLANADSTYQDAQNEKRVAEAFKKKAQEEFAAATEANKKAQVEAERASQLRAELEAKSEQLKKVLG